MVLSTAGVMGEWICDYIQTYRAAHTVTIDYNFEDVYSRHQTQNRFFGKLAAVVTNSANFQSEETCK
jgi:hypothetical protein